MMVLELELEETPESHNNNNNETESFLSQPKGKDAQQQRHTKLSSRSLLLSLTGLNIGGGGGGVRNNNRSLSLILLLCLATFSGIFSLLLNYHQKHSAQLLDATEEEYYLSSLFRISNNKYEAAATTTTTETFLSNDGNAANDNIPGESQQQHANESNDKNATKEGVQSDTETISKDPIIFSSRPVTITFTTDRASSSKLSPVKTTRSSSKTTSSNPESPFKTTTSNPEEFGSEEYLNHADAVILRAMSAILEEYGQDPLLVDNKSSSSSSSLFECPAMFAWENLDLSLVTEPPVAFQKHGNRGTGGWTSPKSWNGLVLRLVQALWASWSSSHHQQKQSSSSSSRSSSIDFTVVLAGHSAATGHGNHFVQSYLMQMQKIMDPVFRQLGVHLISRNLAQGGLGTVHSSLGFNSIYGSEIDLILWDSGMTENHKPEHIDLFFRQALMADGRVPVVWGAGGQFDLLKLFYNEAGADVGEFGLGWDGIPETTGEKQVQTLPWAVQRLKCSDDRPDLCREPYKFCATCWIDRPDKIRPVQKQYETPHGQVKWHPGWRSHQLQGRVLAFALLQALKDAVEMIRNDDSDKVNVAMMNMTDYYDSIRNKIKNLDPSLGHCYKINASLPDRICRTPMKGRTQYTPRTNPTETSITSIIKAAPPDGYKPQNTRTALYNGPDAHNPCFDLPEGAVDVVARIDQGLNYSQRQRYLGSVTSRATNNTTDNDDSADTTRIIPGRGWQLIDEPQGMCDGTYDSICAKSTHDRCVLYGHHDERGAVIGSEMAGWLVLQVPRDEIRAGVVVVKLHTWYAPEDNYRTITWKTINNAEADDQITSPIFDEEGGDSSDGPHSRTGARTRRHLASMVSNATATAASVSGTSHLHNYDASRILGRKRRYKTPELNKWFQFDYAIDGEITSLNKTQFLDQKQDIQDMVEILVLSDQSIPSNKTTSTMEIAFRLRHCYHQCVFGISHIYWA